MATLTPSSSLPLTARLLTLVFLTGAAQAALAQNAYEQDTASYRCTVLGDSSSCAPSLPQPKVSIEDRLEPGPRAKYLISLGLDRDEAIKQAHASGESPTRQWVRTTRNTFSGEALYRQAAGETDLPQERVETKTVP